MTDLTPNAEVERGGGEWLQTCPCDFRHPSTQLWWPSNRHEQGCRLYRTFDQPAPEHMQIILALQQRLRVATTALKAAHEAHCGCLGGTLLDALKAIEEAKGETNA